MTIKKYPQSNLLISGATTKIMIDPGNVTFNNGFTPVQFQGLDGYLITHQHGDHMDPENIKEVVGKFRVYGNSDVVAKLKELGVVAIEIKNKEPFTIGEFEITPIDLPHGQLPGGNPVPPNTGFLLRQETSINGILFHPGDGNIAPEGLTSENVALPVAGPSINLESALKFAQDLQAKIVIPIHYNSRFPVDLNEFKNLAYPKGIEVRVLEFEEETQI